MTFPAEMLVDYVRVYQRDGHTNVGCDPPDHPTANYINNHPEAYNSLCSYRATIPMSLTVSSRRPSIVVLDARSRRR